MLMLRHARTYVDYKLLQRELSNNIFYGPLSLLGFYSTLLLHPTTNIISP
jgi:hypothetical protein